MFRLTQCFLEAKTTHRWSSLWRYIFRKTHTYKSKTYTNECWFRTVLQTWNYILITLHQHTLYALFTKSSTLKIGDNPCINLSPSPSNTAQAPKTSIPPTHIGITNRHGLMPSSYKIKIIVILGSSTSTIPWILQISPSGSCNGGTFMVVMLITLMNIL